MKLTWICPTWNRPECLRNLIAQFKAQEHKESELLILDDSGQYSNQEGSGWQLISFKRPFHTLPEKYNALLGMATSDAIVIAEDDDLYSPQHSSACEAALQVGRWCKPSKVKSLYGGKLNIEDSAGRFHASIACWCRNLRHVGGWPITQTGDFDQQLIKRLETECPASDPIALGFEPTYTFNWDKSGHSHGQSAMQGPRDQEWLTRARIAAGPIEYVGELFPDASEFHSYHGTRLRERIHRA